MHDSYMIIFLQQFSSSFSAYMFLIFMPVFFFWYIYIFRNAMMLWRYIAFLPSFSSSFSFLLLIYLLILLHERRGAAFSIYNICRLSTFLFLLLSLWWHECWELTLFTLPLSAHVEIFYRYIHSTLFLFSISTDILHIDIRGHTFSFSSRNR